MIKCTYFSLFLLFIFSLKCFGCEPVGLCLQSTNKKFETTRQIRCPSVTFYLPRLNQIQDYVRYRRYVPRMTEVTACAWIEATDFINDVYSIVSYAPTRALNNAYFIGIDNSSHLRTHIMNGYFPQTVVPPLGKKFHFCQWFSSFERQGGYYINGIPLSPFSYTLGPLTGGGDMIFGQEQDDVDAGGLVRIQAFRGNISNFMIWPRVLSSKEIYEIAGYCSCPVDYNIILSLDRVELFGQAYYSIPDTCPTL